MALGRVRLGACPMNPDDLTSGQAQRTAQDLALGVEMLRELVVAVQMHSYSNKVRYEWTSLG